MTRRPTVLFYCQHSLGLGHLVRSFALADALSQDFRVVVLNGGHLPAGTTAPEGVELVSLPPLTMDTDGVLVGDEPGSSVERTLELRRERILSVQRTVAPDVVFVELFPFGRRKFRGEIVPLLRAARAAGAMTVCSLRDILMSKRRSQDRFDEWACGLANELLDAVFVHADPRFARLEESFRPQTPLRVPVHYTGFVTPSRPVRAAARPAGAPRIVVSAGGGRYGEQLLRTAVEAHRLSLAERGVRLRVLAGPFVPDDAWRSLRAAAADVTGVDVRRSVPDLTAELASAAASVSQCGYNTTLDILRSGVPALVVPFAQGREDEQPRRAERLAALGAVRVLAEKRLDAPTLAAELEELLRFRPAEVDLDLDGGPAAARLLASLWAQATRKSLAAVV